MSSPIGEPAAGDAEFQGDMALALEEYPPEVWKRFVFEREKRPP